MSVCLSDFKVCSPASLDEALEVMAGNEQAMPLAGGTDLMVDLDAGKLAPGTFVNLQAVSELRGPPELSSDGALCLNALTTFRQTRIDSRLRESFPLLSLASREIGAPAVQSSATWVGNIVNGSPAADGVPVLLVHDAEIEVASLGGRRRLPLHQFFSGYKQNELKRGELVTAIYLPSSQPNWKIYYRKVGTRRFQAISKTLLAARIQLEGQRVADIRLALASVAPNSFRAYQTEEMLRDAVLSPATISEAARLLEQEINPIDDLRSNAAYRRRVSGNLLREFLEAIAETVEV